MVTTRYRASEILEGCILEGSVVDDPYHTCFYTSLFSKYSSFLLQQQRPYKWIHDLTTKFICQRLLKNYRRQRESLISSINNNDHVIEDFANRHRYLQIISIRFSSIQQSTIQQETCRARRRNDNKVLRRLTFKIYCHSSDYVKISIIKLFN